MDLEFSGEIIHWRGPAPFHFVATPEEPSAAIEAVSSLVTYGWGAIPAMVRIGDTEFRTSLFPKGARCEARRRRHRRCYSKSGCRAPSVSLSC